jgi:hypothetical protein
VFVEDSPVSGFLNACALYLAKTLFGLLNPSGAQSEPASVYPAV